MSRRIKQLVESDLKARYGDLREAVVVNLIGLTGTDNNKLRRVLRAKKLQMHVVPNRAFRRAIGDATLKPLAKGLNGPCAIVSGGDSVIETAKELVKLATEFPKLELKIALVEGFDDILPLADASKLRSRVETIGDLVLMTISPGRKLAGAIQSSGGKIAGCLKAIIEKHEKGAAAPAA